MGTAYLDACTIIYLIVGTNSVRQAALARIDTPAGTARTRLVTSVLSLIECKAKPVRDRDAALVARYDAFFSAADVALLPISLDVIERATELRADQRFRVPDAIHLATSILARADRFITGDAALTRCPDVRVDVLCVAENPT